MAVKITRSSSKDDSKEKIAASLAASMSIGAFSGQISGSFKLGDAVKIATSRDKVDVFYTGAV